MNYDFLITQIKNIPPADLAARGVITPARKNANGEKTYICPICNNGTGKTGDGIAFKNEGGVWLAKCFKCGRGFDNISLLALHYGFDTRAGFTEILKRAAADFGIATDFNFNDFNSYHNLTPLKMEKPAQDPILLEVKTLTNEYIKQALSLPDNLEKLAVEDRRGLSVETLRYFRCVFVENWLHPKTFAEYRLGLRDKLPPRSRRILIPTADGNHYNAVLVKADRTESNKKSWKMHAGVISLFGIETIHGAGVPALENLTNSKLFFDEYKNLSPADQRLYSKKNFAYLELAFCAQNKIPINAVKIVYVFEGEINAMTEWRQYQKLAFIRYSADIFDCKEDVYRITDADEQGEKVSQGAFARKAFIATCSASNKSWVEQVDSKCKALNIRPIFIIRFDNDAAGKAAAEYAKVELMKRGYPVKISLYDGGKS